MFKPGDDVVVIFDGEECAGEVIKQENGWVLTKVLVDPEVDFGEFTSPNLVPYASVMVRDSDVRLAR